MKGASAGSLVFGLGSIVKQTVFCCALTSSGKIINKESNLVLNHSYENKRYLTRLSQKGSGNKLKYYIKYKIFYKLYTLLLFLINLIKKIILLRF